MSHEVLAQVQNLAARRVAILRNLSAAQEQVAALNAELADVDQELAEVRAAVVGLDVPQPVPAAVDVPGPNGLLDQKARPMFVRALPIPMVKDQILALVAKHRSLAPSELRTLIPGAPGDRVKKSLAELVAEGRLDRSGNRRTTRYRIAAGAAVQEPVDQNQTEPVPAAPRPLTVGPAHSAQLQRERAERQAERDQAIRDTLLARPFATDGSYTGKLLVDSVKHLHGISVDDVLRVVHQMAREGVIGVVTVGMERRYKRRQPNQGGRA